MGETLSYTCYEKVVSSRLELLEKRHHEGRTSTVFIILTTMGGAIGSKVVDLYWMN